MEIDEVVARLTRRYWALLLVAVVAPIAVVGWLSSKATNTYTAHARIAVSADIPKSVAESSALVGQVDALATSRDVVQQAIASAGNPPRNADTIAANDVAVAGNGASSIVDLSVTDRDPAVAKSLTNSLASAVANAFDTSRTGNLPTVIAGVDKQLGVLAARRAPIAASISSKAAANPHDPQLTTLQSQLAGIDTLIADLSADRSRLAEQLAAAGETKVVQTADQPAHANSHAVAEKMALAGLGGLIAGLIIAAVAETVRPTISGAARLAKLLGAPMLGKLSAKPVALHALGRRVRLAARRAKVSQIVVTSTSSHPVPESLLDRLRAVVLDPLHGYDFVAAEQLAGTAAEQQELAMAGATRPKGAHPIQADGPEASIVPPASNGHHAEAPQIQGLTSLDELSPEAETGAVGILVLAGGTTHGKALHQVRDLADASGWPLLGVVSQSRRRFRK